MRMPWGRYQGHDVGDLPLSYLGWLLEEAVSLRDDLRDAIEAEVARRVGAHRRNDCRDVARWVPAPEIAQAASDIIAAGYRAAARRAHPDTGGDHAAMIAVGQARDWLRRAVEVGA